MRRLSVVAGIVLVTVGLATWFLPLALSERPAVTETVEITRGSAKTTKEALGWGVIHSDEILITLIAAGLVLVLLGALPRGAIKKISIFGTEIELGLDEFKTVVATVTAKASPDKAEEIIGSAIEELGETHGDSQGKFSPSRAQLEAAVDRAIERESSGD
ncbi:MAG TPA: hypothetical protein VLC07_09225 [Solirubrobacterales bacterium]|nr:hypothetical protein [Solirubrobacterales bacterium]